jgi:hypothetical protein
MRNAMRLLTILGLLSPVFALTNPDPTVADARITGIQKITSKTGIAFTGSELYRTTDGGATWNKAGFPIADGSVIAGVMFANELRGWAVIHDNANARVVIGDTRDGGESWQFISTGADAFGDDAYLDRVSIGASLVGGLTLMVRIPTSSNFVGQKTYRSFDGGHSWRMIERSVRLRTSDEPDAIRSGDWSLKTEGSCAGHKQGCIQETILLNGAGHDITPPDIRTAMHTAKQSARDLVREDLLIMPPGGSTRISLNRGFDKCTAATVAQMQTWWNTSPHYDSNIYISGRNRACSQAQLTASWVDQVSAMGWGLIPTVVGYQSPCISNANFNGARFSSDPATAETQGRGEADIAVADAANLGLTAGSILYYDMERYDETVSTPGCRAASTAFLKGWTERVRELGYKSGTYGSPRNAIDDWQFMPSASRMEAIWMARWDNVPSVWTYVSFANFPNNVWDNHQRIKQWQAPHDETWGGVTFNIDGNIADGPVAGVAVAKNKNADFDGDGKTDVSVFRPENGVWYILNSSNWLVSYVQFGLAGDIPTPGDYDGDGRTDPAVYRPSQGIWHLLTKANNYTARQWGVNGDLPVAADYNGDGKTDLALFRPSNGVWYIANSDSLGTFVGYGWGANGDKPVAGDYDGDGKSDFAVFRPSNGVWYVVRSSDGGFSFTPFGLNGDLPAQGDFDGDGKTDRVLFRPSNRVWYILRSSDGGVSYYTWGENGDLPVTGDYDNDGKADVGLFRPSDGGWYVLLSGGGFLGSSWGAANDAAVPNAYLPR